MAAYGEAKLSSVTFRAGDDTWEEECDLLACGFGFVPNLELPMLLGCQIENGAVIIVIPNLYDCDAQDVARLKDHSRL